MPRGDGTGPLGFGPMTGRAAGYCAGFPVPGYMNPWAGWPWWFGGRGRGRGFRWMYYMTGLPGWARYGYPLVPSVPFVPGAYPGYPAGYPAGPGASGYGAPPEPGSEQERRFLKEQARLLEVELGEIKARLDELESDEGKGEGDEREEKRKMN